MNRVCVRRDLAPGNCDRRHRPAGEFFVVLIAQLERRTRRLRVVALDLEGDPLARTLHQTSARRFLLICTEPVDSDTVTLSKALPDVISLVQAASE